MAIKSNHLPKNTSIETPLGRAELFWQTTNCVHFMQNYREDSSKTNPNEKVHNLQFSDVSKMLSGNVAIDQVKKSDKYYAVSYWNDRYYYTIFTIERRTDESNTLFAIIIHAMQTLSKATKRTAKKSVSNLDAERPKGPWFRVDGKWYTKNAEGEIIRYYPPKN